MTTYAPRSPKPVRRDLTDPRSSAGPAPSRKTLLTDVRSTRRRA